MIDRLIAPGPTGRESVHHGGMQDVPIRDDVIRLGQFLKLAGIADSGADAAAMLAEDTISVNGEPEQRRGRQLHKGDVVTTGAQSVRVG